MTELAIDIKGLTKVFSGRVAVDHLSLQVEKGAIFGFLGSNGSGKTTTIRMLSGLLTPTEGEGQCLGYDIKTQSDEIKKQVGYMPQQFSFYKGLTVYQNLRFVADIFQVAHANQAINTIIHDLQLETFRTIQAGNLSGGWKQRLTLACCLLHQPQLLFLDEPTAGIDPKARKEFWDYLHDIATKNKTTILVTTHYMDEAEKCTNLAYINLGKLLYSGPTKNLIPYSKVKTYVLEGHFQEQERLKKQIRHSYPDLQTSTVNNQLRIYSPHEQALAQFIQEQPHYSFKEVQPSFEEAFIGLIP